METIHQRRTTAAQAGVIKPPGARRSVFDTGTTSPTSASPKGRGGLRQRLPELDLSSVTFQLNAAPHIPMAGVPGGSKWAPVFDRLKADGNALEGIPTAYRGSLNKVAGDWHERSPELAQSRFIVRTSQDGKSIGLYRVAAKDAPAPRKKAGA